MNLNDFSKWLQYNSVKNLRGSEYFPYPLYIVIVFCKLTLHIYIYIYIYTHTNKSQFKVLINSVKIYRQ